MPGDGLGSMLPPILLMLPVFDVRAAVTVRHQLGGLNKEVNFLLSLETVQKSRCPQVWFPPSAVAGVCSGRSPSF